MNDIGHICFSALLAFGVFTVFVMFMTLTNKYFEDKDDDYD